MTKLNGPARLVLSASMQHESERATGRARVKAVFNSQPHYNIVDLQSKGSARSTSLTAVAQAEILLSGSTGIRIVSTKEANPLGIACPRRRRVNTVQQNEEATHHCNYSGCFGYTRIHSPTK